jgi:hypothetical protein
MSGLWLAGCATLPPAERQTLIDASRNYTQGNRAAAVTALDRIIRDYDKAAEIGEAYYIRGLCRVQAGQDGAAVEDFERAIARSSRSDLVAQCRASLAAIAFKQGDFNGAAHLYEKAVDDLRDVPPTDQILYTAGIAMQRAGHWEKANFQFARILNRFRTRPIAADARRMVAWRHPYYAVQLGAFRDTDRAAKLLQDLRKQGFDAVQEYVARGNDSMWVVMTGRYQNYSDARASLAQIRQRQPQAIIVP